MTIKHIHIEEVDSTNRYLRDYRKTEGEDITFAWIQDEDCKLENSLLKEGKLCVSWY